MQYTIIRSMRRTLALEITPDLEILVRAPRFLPNGEIERFVRERENWIVTHLEMQRVRQQNRPPEPSAAQIAALKAAAAQTLPPLVQTYAAKMGVTPTGIKITSAKKRFGSCSGKNSLCFSWRLMQYPSAAIAYVVVHELAHIRHHDHSPAFYRTIEQVMPDYKEREKLLKK